MRVDLFDFDLPEDRIALRPVRPRDSARLLMVRPGQTLADRGVLDLPDLLAPGDLLVFNDTRVIPAALNGVRPARAEGGGGDVAIEVGAPWQRLRLPWQSVHLARVTRVVGEDLLELWATADPADTSPRPPMRTVSILLPIGADLDALHALLAARLGLADGVVTAPA